MLGGYTLDLILCGIAYLILVYLMVTLMRKRSKDIGRNDDDDDGGLTIKGPPQVDLPPGICMPDGTPRLIFMEEDEREDAPV